MERATTVVSVCAVLGTGTMAPTSRPKDCATRTRSSTEKRVEKKAPAEKCRPPIQYRMVTKRKGREQSMGRSAGEP